MHPKVKFAALVATLLALVACGCATIAPGHDPVIVNTERALRAADAIYANAMRYYFSPGVAPNLGRDAVVAFEKLRTGYDAPYKGVQAALDVYKLARTEANRALLRSETERLAAVTNPAVTHTPGKLAAVEVK